MEGIELKFNTRAAAKISPDKDMAQLIFFDPMSMRNLDRDKRKYQGQVDLRPS